MNGLKASILVFSSEPSPFGRPHVNMDPEVIGLLREIDCLHKLQCPIQPIAIELWLKADYLKDYYEQLKVSSLAGLN
ncbi:unnamed protein product [Protopolystoma xenopodis]|uniref:Dynein heavy chain tail domain-containing protein n=1 Tax=Protopolystoma xenopodis TaxID=117903 RepID=A0A3S5CQE9_9PLAT|nr:unnamed protein product [Protopolystoma xenopodis]